MKAYIIPIKEYEAIVRRGKAIARFRATTPEEFFKIELNGDKEAKNRETV